MIWHHAVAFFCVCIMGCATFQSGPSEPVAAGERLEIAARGQLRVIDRNPEADETILLIHGYGSSTASYGPVIPELAQRYRVIAIDLPGFGKSDRLAGDYSPDALADVLAAVLDAKKVFRAHVVGHSWGASVALAFARRHADRTAKLVLLSAFVFDDQLLPFLRWARVPGVGEALYALFYRQSIGERLTLNFHDPSLVTDEVVESVERQMALDGAVAAALAAARGMRFAEREADYRKVTADALLVWGAEDRVSRPAFGERLLRDLPHARLALLPGCGHIPMIECRGDTLEAIRTFLGGMN